MIAQKTPRIALVTITLGIVILCQASIGEAKSSKKGAESKATTAASQQSDDAAIRAQMANMSKSLADGNAKALGAAWTEDGTYIDSDGGICKGRDALEKRFVSVFSKEGRQAVEFVPDSIKMLSPNVALSEGVVRRKDAPEGPTPETRYSLTFVKQDGNWLITSASETPLAPEVANNEPLKELSWMIGEWSAEANGGSVRMKADWAASKNFIVCQYETKKSADAPQLESRQVIGWDPRSGEPISWHFDSSGGFGFGNWVKKEHQWMVDASGVDRDGSTTAATNVISIGDTDNFTFQSVNRSVNGVAFNDSNPLKVHRVVK